MKKLLLFTCMLLSASLLFGQKNWIIKSIDLSFGYDEDRVTGISDDYFSSMIKDENLTYVGPEFDDTDIYSMVCENPYIRLSATLSPIGLKNTELRLGLNGIFNRYDGVSYNMGGGYTGTYYSSSTTGDELAVEASFLKSANWRVFRAFGGLGVNTGYAFNNRMHSWVSDVSTVNSVSLRGDNIPIEEVMYNAESYHDAVKLRNGVSQRAFLHAGVGILFFRRVELSLEGRYGYGYRWMGGTSPHGVRLQSIAINASYQLFK